MCNCSGRPGRGEILRRGFTITELSVVVTIIGTLASLLMPSLSKGKSAAMAITCLNNLRQLQLGWQMYADDHNDVLAPNSWLRVDWGDGCPQGYPAVSGAWVLGSTLSDGTGWGIRNGVLYPYVGNAGVYHCPADKSTIDGNRRVRRTRSYSASFYMNGNTNQFDPQVKSKTTEIHEPSASFVFLEEHPNSIDDGVFFFHTPGDAGERDEVRQDPRNRYRGAHWMNMPADRHNQGCNVTFADGGARRWKWLWPKNLASPDADRDIANDLDFHDYRTVQAGIPDVTPEMLGTIRGLGSFQSP